MLPQRLQRACQFSAAGLRIAAKAALLHAKLVPAGGGGVSAGVGFQTVAQVPQLAPAALQPAEQEKWAGT